MPKPETVGCHGPGFGNPFDNTGAGILTIEDLKSAQESLTVPVSPEAAVNPALLQELIFFLNKSGKKIIILATTHGPDIKTETPLDPANFNIEVRETVPPGCLTCFTVCNDVTVEWSIRSPPKDTTPVWYPGLEIPNPNGQTIVFTRTAGVVSSNIYDTEQSSPNTLRLQNNIINEAIDVRVTKYIAVSGGQTISVGGSTNTLRRPTSVVFNLGAKEWADYAQQTNLIIWICEFSDIVPAWQYGSQTNNIPVPNGAGAVSSRDVRVGTSLIWGNMYGICPGTYIIAVVGPNRLPTLQAYSTRSLHTYPVNNYKQGVKVE